MPPVGVSAEFLSAVRISRMFKAIEDVRVLTPDLPWLGRTVMVDADDNEIMARYNGRIQIADLITDDAQAVTYTTGKMTLYTNTAPNIKHGEQMTQSMIRQLGAIRAGGGDVGLFNGMENRIMTNLVEGIRHRQEALIMAMLLDSLTYDRLGVKITAGWGTPSALKTTVSITWDNPTTATPVSDILTQKRYAQVVYGINYDRMTMSRVAFDYMVATTEFQNKARMFLAPNVSFTNISLQNTQALVQLASNVIGVAIELQDNRYWQQAADGTTTSAPFLPITKVLLTSTANDRNPNAWDWAQGVSTESQLAGIAGVAGGGQIGNGLRGTFSYTTVDEDLNPPSITYWAVNRGFPRKHLLQSNAVLTVGSFTDTIPVTDVF